MTVPAPGRGPCGFPTGWCAVVLVSALLQAMAAADARAERRVLLVGVQEYAPAIAARAPSLSGPANDVALMRRMLLRLGTPSEAITTLVSGAPHPTYGPLSADGPATRAQILAALDRLVEVAGQGDEVVILLAGHGAVLPAAGRHADADGLDEVFLPADFELSETGGVTTVRNHIRDEELGSRLSAILGRGASVWLIADTCHAAGIERNAAAIGRGPGVARVLPLGDWETGTLRDGNPPEPGADGPSALGPGAAMSGSAAFVGFYAAPSGSLALEAPLGAASADEAGGRPVHGLLTWAVVQALSRGETARFSDLARAARAGAWAWGWPAPEPVFAGDLARATGLPGDGAAGLAVRAAPDGTLRLGGGRLDGIGAGDVIDVVLSPGDGRFAVEVIAAGLVEAAVVPVIGAAGEGALAALIAAEGLEPVRFRDRWLADRAPAMVARTQPAHRAGAVRVARPGDLPPALSDRIEAALALASTSIALSPVAPGAEADIALSVGAGAIGAAWDPVQVEGGQIRRSIGATVPEIAELIVRAARARRLVSAAQAFAATPTARALSAEALVAPAERSSGPCTPLADVPVAALPGSAPSSTAGPCDHVQLRLENLGAGPLDVAPFYLAPDGALHYLQGYPGGDLFGLRLDPGAVAFVSFTEDGSLAGPVRLIVLALSAQPDAPYPVDLRALAAPGPVLRSADAGSAAVAGSDGPIEGNSRSELSALAEVLVAAPRSASISRGGSAIVSGMDAPSPVPEAGAVVLSLEVSGP
jgi:hypothetical protein